MKNNELAFVASKWTVKIFNIIFSRTTWKIVFILIFLLTAYACYRMFISNYQLQKPWVRKGTQDAYIELWNDRAMCLTDIQKYDSNYRLMSDR